MRISWEVIVVFLTSTVKFLPTPFAAAGLGMSYWQAFLLVGIGGSLGVTLFYVLGKIILNKKKKPSNKKKFTKMNRWIIRIKHRFGLVGIALITPPLISIPVGTIIAAKFYRHRKDVLPMLLLSVWFWDVLLTSAVHLTMSLF